MASARRKFVVRLHLIGLVTALLLGSLVAAQLQRAAANPDDPRLVIEGTLVFLLAALVAEQILVRILLQQILKPMGRAAMVASRVAQGDLSLQSADDGRDKDVL